MKVVKNGDKVKILCEAKLENGEIYYTWGEDNPLEIVIGEGTFFPAAEEKMKNMKEGETKTITLEPDEAFGPYMEELVLEVPREAFRPDAKLEKGARIRINTPSGKVFYGTIAKVNDNTVILDLNHPLAGKKIILTITVISIHNGKQSLTDQ
ncbi:MAG: FKBP-type peptidyl-prolyl cis-trans isomerase [Thermoplasmata archaeon]|nr:FKBP-type peptidyl-prolyl cis-trans isomerase [Thermoplasmata archaeon]